MLSYIVEIHPATRVFRQQSIDKTCELLRTFLRRLAHFAQDIVFCCCFFFLFKRSKSMIELENKDAQTPKVNHLIVASIRNGYTFHLKDLRSHILKDTSIAYKRLLAGAKPRQSIVGQFDVSFWRHQRILRFEVPIYDIIRVQERYCFNNFWYNFFNELLSKLLMCEIVVEISSLHILHNYVYFLLVLKYTIDLGQERVMGGSQNLLHVVGLQQVCFFDLSFVNYLHRVDFIALGVFALYHYD